MGFVTLDLFVDDLGEEVAKNPLTQIDCKTQGGKKKKDGC